MPSRRIKIISLIAIILIVGGVVLISNKAEAQTANGPVANPTGATGALNNVINHPFSSFSTLGLISNMLLGASGSTNSAVGAVAKSVGICTGVTDCINGALIVLSNLALHISNLILTLSGIMLNAVMIITLNMATLMGGSNNIIDATWSTIRDMASIIIIFFLLYVSIKMILGLADTTLKHIVVMVAIAGILINFSLFFAKLGVDTSNLVGLAFYRAIAPSGANLDLSSATVSAGNFLSNTFTSGGISDTFMKALKIQTADAYTGVSTDPLTIIQSALYGTILQLIAAFVFLAAAFLFIIRVGLLIVLLVFSPFYFIGLIVPKVEEKISKQWLDMIIDQCLILPIFMFFMYIAMRVITNSGFQSIINPATGSTALAGTAAATIGMFIQYLIAIILICISLVAALKYASVGKDLVQSSINKVKKYGTNKLSNIPSSALRNTVGRGASYAQEKLAASKFAANNPNAALLFNKASGAVAGTSWGGQKGGFAAAEKKRLETQDKNRKDVYERIGNVHREDYKTDDAFDKARRAALERQGQFVTNLRSNSIISHMTGGRNIGIAPNPFNVTGGANLRSADKLGKTQEKAEAKEYKKDNQEEMKRNDAEIKELKGKLGAGSMLFDRSGKEITRNDAEKKDIQKRIDALEDRNEDLNKRLNRAAAVEKEEDKVEQAKATAKAIKDQEKESGGEGEPKAKPAAPKPPKPTP